MNVLLFSNKKDFAIKFIVVSGILILNVIMYIICYNLQNLYSSFFYINWQQIFSMFFFKQPSFCFYDHKISAFSVY